MREIKFRAWTNGKMNYINYPARLTYGDNRLTYWEELNHVADLQAIVMQYTGFNLGEKEIYEGDILREEDGDEIFYAVVTWIKEWCMFACLIIKYGMNEYETYLQMGAKGLDESMFWTFPLTKEKYGKKYLAGNIYENSELLK